MEYLLKNENDQNHLGESKEVLYGKMFYLFLNDPVFLSALMQSSSINDNGAILLPILKDLFEQEEESKILRVIMLLIKYKFANLTEPSMFLRGNTPSTNLIRMYCKNKESLEYLKAVLKPTLDAILSLGDDSLETERDEVKRYVTESYNRTAKDRIFRLHKDPDEMERHIIKEVELKIASRKELLNNIVYNLLKRLSSSLDKVPKGIKIICSSIKKYAVERYGKSDKKLIHSLIGGFFFLRYLNPHLVFPEELLPNSVITTNFRKNVTKVARIIQQLANKAHDDQQSLVNSTLIAYIIEKVSEDDDSMDLLTKNTQPIYTLYFENTHVSSSVSKKPNPKKSLKIPLNILFLFHQLTLESFELWSNQSENAYLMEKCLDQLGLPPLTLSEKYQTEVFIELIKF